MQIIETNQDLEEQKFAFCFAEMGCVVCDVREEIPSGAQLQENEAEIRSVFSAEKKGCVGRRLT